jgi:hypothetical protein
MLKQYLIVITNTKYKIIELLLRHMEYFGKNQE